MSAQEDKAREDILALDREAIDAAYTDGVKRLFEVLNSALLDRAPDATPLSAARTRALNGLRNLRETRAQMYLLIGQ